MAHADFWSTVERIRATDGRYSREAYAFVMEALDATVRRAGERRHVSGGELIRGAIHHARQRYGMLAWDVLRRWGIVGAGDIGDIVFQLIDAGILSRREEDSRADFDDPVDFRVALEEQYFSGGSGG